MCSKKKREKTSKFERCHALCSTAAAIHTIPTYTVPPLGDDAHQLVLFALLMLLTSSV